MAIRKFSAERIFDGHRFVKDQVLVIQESGAIEGLIPAEEAGEGVQVVEGLLLPGFINCHCHLELSHMRGAIPEGTGLVDFVFKVVSGRHYAEEIILQAIDEAEEEMVRNGIVAVGDICNNTLTIPQKKKNQLSYYNFIEASGWIPGVAEQRFQRSMELWNAFSELSGRQQQAMVPHAPYSVSENLWQKIVPYFKRRTVSIHNQEAPFEDELFIQGTGDFIRMYELMKMDPSHFQPSGKSSLQTYFDRLDQAANILLVHNTFMKQPDIDFIQRRSGNPRPETFLCLCVNANRYIENALPPVDLFRKHACQLVLGTDSLASNRNLSIASEIHTVQEAFPDIPLEELLTWATRNGAKALHMDDRLGSFERGKVPGVLEWGADGSIRRLI
jgi:aminodeoxyfutalosine deaminase